MAYAKNTDVPVHRSRAELEALLERHGCTGFATSWDKDTSHEGIQFKIPTEGGDRVVAVQVPIPKLDDPDVKMSPGGRLRTEPQRQKAQDQWRRARWRLLAQVVKMKLEAIEADLTTIEREFLADLVLQDGRTVGQSLAPVLSEQAGGSLALTP